MKTEKIVLSFVAVIIGLAVAAGAFYLYQTTKTIPESQIKNMPAISQQTPTPASSSIFLTVDEPKDEAVFDKKTIAISGKTDKDAIIIISTNTNDEVITPAGNGNFSTTTTIENGQSQITIIAVAPNGEEQKIVRTVTFSTEEF